MSNPLRKTCRDEPGGSAAPRVLVTGAAGLLGRQIVRVLAPICRILPTGRKECDVTSAERVRREIARFAPDVVIHCAAYTAVDRAETDRDAAFLLNETGTRNVARACGERGIPLVTYGTDYVFDGRSERPYREEDPANPLSVYGKSKRAAEIALAEEASDWLLIRTQWLFGPGGPDFVTAILRKADREGALQVVKDQVGCPTFAPDLAEATVSLLDRGARGIVHFSNAGQTSFFEYAVFLLKESGRGTVRVDPVRTADLPPGAYPAPRPARSVLDKGKYVEITGSHPRPWQEAVREYLGMLRTGSPS
ncbi:MAG: dTDP-4-dehydrorhamnose reductase [Deltaproteobacteria bacterium]